ncbi:hypothetical protein [Peptoniphilus mikwangii]|uniref:hypothetical protein n=1 Tax=Peptoniphilus mikwangii TaxID=1354300 RepID=UPI0003FC9D5B|nr:hypothetical protein [Peptoniphilus mikwangii]
MEIKDKNERVYSYHTFLLPFEILKSDNETLCSKEEIENVLNQEYWKRLSGDHLSAFDSVISTNGIKKDDSKKKNNNLIESVVRLVEYNQEQYFHNNVKKAIHDDGKSGIVSEYVFQFDEKNTKRVIIKKFCKKIKENLNINDESTNENKNTNDNNEYVLKVSNVRLKLFNTGIGILILELCNDLYRNFKSVKDINELGRHISLPYIALENKNIASAQILIWDFLHSDEKEYNFGEKNECFLNEKSPKEKTYMLDFLKNIILKKEQRLHHDFKPSLDDRMFTCCLIQDDRLARVYSRDYIAQKDDDAQFKKLSKYLYEYIYIDKDNSCTAATFSFRKNILNNSLYHRWTEIGTIYGASHTSFVAITGEGEFLDTIITWPFLTQYVEIAILVLVQRASILRFQKQIQSNMDNKKIRKLQSEYIDYRNQLHFFEVSSQEQGIELYELIQKQLYIKKEMEALEKNLEILYEKNNVDYGNKFNRFGLFIGCIAILSILLDLMNFILGRDFSIKFCGQFKLIKCELLMIFLTTFLIFSCFWKSVKWKK